MTNEYSDFIKQDQTSDLRSALAVAAQRQPDTEAQLQKLAGRTGVPVDAVRMQRPEVELHDKLEAFDYERVIKDSPKLSAWMAKPDNAALAQDDWQTLSAMERGITHIKDYAGALGGGVVGDAIGRTLSGASTLLDVGARAIDRPVRAAFGDRVADAFWYEPTALDPFQSLKSTGQSLKAAGDWMKPPQERQTLGTDVAGGIGQIGGQIATHLLTGGTLTVPTLLAQGADVMADKTAKDIADPALKDTAIIAGGAITAITEKYGLDKLLNRVPPEVKNRTLRFMADKVAAGGIEAGQEFAEGLLHDIARRTLTNKDAELLDGVGREMTAAGLSAAIVRTALGVKGHARAKEQEQFVKALTDQAAESKLRERMPEKFREYLDQVTAGGPVENIFIPADQFATYYQSVGLDPAVEASKLGVQNFAEARAAGTDVVIPTADFVTQLSGSDHLQGLWQDLRFSQAEMTLREAAQYERNQDATPIDDEVLARYGAGDATTSAPGFQQVKEALLGELTGRFAPDVADAYATQYASVISTLAERSGIDPVVLAQQYDLSVDMPIPDALRQTLERYDLSIDPLLDRLRSGDMPKDGEAFGASLADFVRNIGGLAPSGDVAWLDEQGTRKPGQRKLLQLDGLSVDAALQAAVEAGYFPGQDAGQLSVADMLNALAEDIGGNRVSSPMQETQAKADLVRGLRELENYLESIGADVSTMTNAQIKARMERSAAQDVAAQYDQADGDKRGQIAIGQNRKMRISLFEKANLSTFLHETGHFYLEVMGDLAQRPEAPQQLRDDYAAIRAWMGLKDGEAIAVEHHEMFARANEAYLREGKAPSPELRMVFQKFKAWLLQIYRSLSALNVELSDEMRQVFDRMYATDQQIDAARGEMEFEAMLLTAEDAGMTPAEFTAYEASVRQAVERGKEQLQAKLMGQLTREQQKWWKEQRANLREEVAAEVDAEPVYAAFKALTEGKTEDGIAAKLSRDALVEQYGKDFLKKMPRSFQRIYTAEGGMDADTAAEVFGFDSGPALLEALANMKPRREMIEAVTDARMVERHGDIRFDGTIADEAGQALHNDQRESVLKIELRAMRRKQAEVEPFIRAERQNVRDAARADRAEADAGAQFVRDALPTVERIGTRRDGTTYTFDAFDPGPMKRAAAGFIGQKMVRDLRPQEYLIASRKAARAAAKAMRAKDFMTAADQKQRELFNHYLYKEATRTVEEVQRKAEWLQKQGTDKKRQALGKAGADYLEQVDAILERYEFKRVPLNQLDRRQSLASWVDAQEAAGNAVSVPEDVLNEARRVNWKQIPVDELRGVHDAVQNITHLAGLKNSLLIKGQRRAFDEVKNELLSAIYSAPLQSTGELDLPNKSQANLRQKGAALWRNFDAVHIKVEQLVEWLDSGNIDGAWARNFFDLADQAQTAEYDLHRRVTVALNKLREDMPKGWQAAMADKLDFDLPVPGGRRQVPTRFTLLSIALNMGNEQNIQRLRDGNKFTDSDLARIRSALTADDMRFVQGAWDAIESLWPDMAALEKRASGLEPEKVVPTPLSVAGETYRGGYFPLVYDSRLSTAGEKQVEGDKSIEAFMASGFGRPTTNKGATKKRAEQVKQPVLLDMNEVIGGHVAKVVKDISHREAVMGLHRILTDDDIKTGLIDRLGEAHYRELRNWTQVLVNDRSDMVNAAKGAAKIAMMARTNLAIVTMGWKISTMMSQFAGFGPAADLVKPSYLGSAMLRSLASPRDTWAMIAEKSGEMRNRVQTLDRDVRDSMRRLADKRSLVADVQRSAFILAAYADRIVTVPTWLGAYNQAMAEGLGEEAAVRAGDRAVRLSQGGGGAKDLAAVQRNNELMKLMTMYYTPFSALYARLRDVGHQQAVQGIGYLPTAVARTIGLVLIPALLGDYLAGRGPDDDEDEVWWAIRKMLLYPVAALPGIRDFSGLMEQKIIALSGEGKMDFQPSYQISPIVSAIGKAYNNLVNKPIDVVAGNAEFDEKAAWGMFESAGLVVGLPTAQVRITGGYLADLMSGEAEPENAAELMQGVLFRRKKE